MKLSKTIIVKILIIAVLIICFIVINIGIKNNRIQQPVVYESGGLFVKTIDCADIFDANPDATFKISFDAYADIAGDVLMYQQNGTGFRYGMGRSFKVTDKYDHYELIVEIELEDDSQKEAFISFEGKSEGIYPHIKNITIEVIDEAE